MHLGNVLEKIMGCCREICDAYCIHYHLYFFLNLGSGTPAPLNVWSITYSHFTNAPVL